MTEATVDRGAADLGSADLEGRPRASPTPGLVDRVRELSVPLGIFAATRVVDGVLIARAARDQVAVDGGPARAFVVEPSPASPGYLRALTNWDGQWYQQIALHGYPDELPRVAGEVQQNAWAFYPGYPTLVRGLMELTGLPYALAATTVSMVAGAAAVCLLFHLLRPSMGRFAAGLSVLALCTYPAAPVLQAGYSESLALLMIVLCVHLLRRQQYVGLGCASLALSLTRPVVPVVTAVIVVHLVLRWRARHERPFPRRQQATATAALVVSALSFAIWPVVSALGTGEASAYLLTQRAWSDGGASYTSWLLTILARPWSDESLLVLLLGALLAAVVLRRTASTWSPEWRAWAVLYPLYLVATTRLTPSILRYAMLAVVPWWPAPVAAREAPRAARWLMVVAVAGLGVVTQYLWIGWFFIPSDSSIGYP